MSSRPRSITVIGWLFVAAGCIGIVGHTWPLVARQGSTADPGRAAESPLDLVLAVTSGTLAIVGGAMVLRGFNWARWLLAVWMGSHIWISALHGWSELLVHVVLFAAISFALFRPRASAYFRRGISSIGPSSGGTGP